MSTEVNLSIMQEEDGVKKSTSQEGEANMSTEVTIQEEEEVIQSAREEKEVNMSTKDRSNSQGIEANKSRPVKAEMSAIFTRPLHHKRKRRKGHKRKTVEIRDGITITVSMPKVQHESEKSENNHIYPEYGEIYDHNISMGDTKGNQKACYAMEEIHMDTSDNILSVNDNNISDMSNISSSPIYLNNCPFIRR